MFCPRCGREVRDTANFCGGCGLPREEIIKANNKPITDSDVRNINDTISQLEDDLTGINPVTDYTTQNVVNTNDESENFVQTEMKFEQKDQESQYAYDNKNHEYDDSNKNNNYTNTNDFVKDKYTEETYVSTTDFIWMAIISGIPIIGIFYVIYLAFIQTGNKTKRSWARSLIIITLFIMLMAFVFGVGITLSLIA